MTPWRIPPETFPITSVIRVGEMVKPWYINLVTQIVYVAQQERPLPECFWHGSKALRSGMQGRFPEEARQAPRSLVRGKGWSQPDSSWTPANNARLTTSNVRFIFEE